MNLLLSLALKILAPLLLGLALLGGGAWLVNDRAYNRGVAATVKRMMVLIEQGAARKDADLDRLKTTPEDKLDEELRRLCERNKKPGQTCAP